MLVRLGVRAALVRDLVCPPAGLCVAAVARELQRHKIIIIYSIYTNPAQSRRVISDKYYSLLQSPRRAKHDVYAGCNRKGTVNTRTCRIKLTQPYKHRKFAVNKLCYIRLHTYYMVLANLTIPMVIPSQ
jgi:hypothetical protein